MLEGTTSTQFALSAWPCRDDDVDAITYITAINANSEVNEQVYKYLTNGDGARGQIMDRRSCLRMVAGGFEDSQIPLRPDLGIDAVDAITYSIFIGACFQFAHSERIRTPGAGETRAEITSRRQLSSVDMVQTEPMPTAVRARSEACNTTEWVGSGDSFTCQQASRLTSKAKIQTRQPRGFALGDGVTLTARSGTRKRAAPNGQG